METRSVSDDLRHYIIILRHWAWLLVLASVLVGGVAYFLTKRMTPVYQASTTMLINEAPSTRSTDYTSIMTSERLAQTYAQLITTQPVLDDVVNRLQLGIIASELKGMINVSPVQDTQLLLVKVKDTIPVRAAEIANTLVAVFIEYNNARQAERFSDSKNSLEAQKADVEKQIQQINESLAALSNIEENHAERDRLEGLQAQYQQTLTYLLQSYEAVRLAETQTTSSVTQVEPAAVPTKPVAPQARTNTILAAIVGFLLASGIIFLIETLDDSLRDPDDASRQLGVPILGFITRYSSSDEPPITISEPRAPVAEGFRSLRTNIQFASVDRPLHSLLITSPSPADGKSTVAVNLGVVIAQGGRSCVLLDSDLRRPRIHNLLNLSNQSGVSELFVQSRIRMDGSLQSTGVPNLSVLTSGNLPPNPSELLGSEKMLEIIHQIEGQSDILIVDSPPILAVTDASVLAPRVDGVLLVVKPGVTKFMAVKQAVEQLRRVGANVIGIVLNEIEFKRFRYYYKSYYYTYYETDPYKAKKSGNNRKNRGGSKHIARSKET
jgi:capsular exopolysaccharide synthesis family protein